MEANQLPTKPGPYYWRESDGDEWEIHTVFIDDELNHTLMALCPMDDTWYATENWGGQWLPIPTAEELVELQAKAKMVDEGQVMMQMAYDANKIRTYRRTLAAL
jgi:hypothetical protein